MTITIVLARSGDLLSISPAIPDPFTKYRDLESAFPGIPNQIDMLLAATPTGNFVHSLSLPDLREIQLVVVESLSIQRVKCDLVRVVKDALAPMQHQASERDVSLKFEGEGIENLSAKIDPVKIAWVISALVGNSLRFVKSGSRHLPGGSVVVKAIYNSAGRLLEFRIEDDGPGIPPEVVDEILKQSAGSPPYRGVALRLARDIVHAHGGIFLVHSVKEGIERGTTINFSLP
ncbi:MAG: sensor histidine kinase, partial [Bdellovibrionota bacterium]